MSIVLNIIPGLFTFFNPEYSSISSIISMVLGAFSIFIYTKKPWAEVLLYKPAHYMLNKLLVHFDNKKGVFFNVQKKEDREQLLTEKGDEILDDLNSKAMANFKDIIDSSNSKPNQ